MPYTFTLIDDKTESIEKLRMYKTAFSWLYNDFVSIQKVFVDTNGEPLISCIVKVSPTETKKHLFRRNELTQFCL